MVPSYSSISTVSRRCQQTIEVEEPVAFTDVQVEIYQLLMQSYTIQLGALVIEPDIITLCNVTEQEVAGGSPPDDIEENVRRQRSRRLTTTTTTTTKTTTTKFPSWLSWLLPGRFFQRRNRLHRASPKMFRGYVWTDNNGKINDDELSSMHRQSIDRTLQTTTDTAATTPTIVTRNLIVMSFTMTYTTRYGYDITNYPFDFANYIATNLNNVTADMQFRFLPVVEAKEVIVYNPDPSVSPTLAPSVLTNQPSISPAPTTLRPTQVQLIEDTPSFIVGLAAGLTFAGLVVLSSIGYVMWVKKNRKSREHKDRAREGGRTTRHDADFHNTDSPHQQWEADEGLEVVVTDYISPTESEDDGMIMKGAPSLAGMYGGSSSRRAPALSSSSHKLSNTPSIDKDGDGSLSADDDDDDDYHQSRNGARGGGSHQVDALQDEFDQYKNTDLEHMRNGVERSVRGSEGMMSLAMTRALMDDEADDVHPSWGEAEDPESIEANALCETNDWLRKNEFTTVEERNIFFQELLNRMVITVRRGMTSPATGTLAIHCCAAMLGLQLEKDLPNNVLLVHGMRKITDLTLGRKYLVDAFISFGKIEGAAIAPLNRGFGFVRFISPKSVQRALERFKVSEIEVQDVSVMIKPLKADADSMVPQYY